MAEGRVIVVGAGLSGLAAAYRLQQAGIDAVVLERGDRPGGRVRTERRDGYVIDTGPDALTASYDHYIGLLRDVGLGDRLAPTSQVVAVLRGGRAHEIDPAKPLRAAATRALSMRAKARIAAGYLKIRTQVAAVNPYELVESAAADDPALTAYDFALDAFGREVTEYLVDPTMRLVTGGGSRHVSHLSVLGAIKSWSAELLNVRGGLDVLPYALAEQVDVRYGAEVTAVEERPDGVMVTTADGGVEGDACIITAPYATAAAVWPALRDTGFEQHVTYVQLVSVTLGYRRRPAGDAYAVVVPTVENDEALLIFHQHNKAPDRAPAGHGLITIYTDTRVTPRFLGRSDLALETWAAGIIEAYWPELAGQRDLAEVTRWPIAGYLTTPGHWRHVRALLDGMPDGRVMLGGDLFGAGSMESAVKWGERAAERVRTGLASAAIPV